MRLSEILFEVKNWWSVYPPEGVMADVIERNQDKLTCSMGSLACQNMSRKWAQLFKKAGLSVDLVHGEYKGEGHTWLEVDGVLFDPTAAQFDDYPDIDEFEYVTHETQEF